MPSAVKKLILVSVGVFLAGVLGISLLRSRSAREPLAVPSPQTAQIGASAVQTSASIAASQPTREGAGTRALTDVEEELAKSSNMRALVHEMLRNGDRRSTLVAVGAINRCSPFPLDAKIFSEKALANLDQHVAQRWRHLVLACEAAGGIDRQQVSAVSSIIKNKYPDLSYINESLQGNEVERGAIDDFMSPLAAAQWLDKKVQLGEVKMLLADGSSAPEATSSLAIQVEACSSSSCDPLFAMVVLCTQQGLCSQSTFAEQVGEVIRREGKVSAGNWELLRARAREALLKFFPGIMSRPRQ